LSTAYIRGYVLYLTLEPLHFGPNAHDAIPPRKPEVTGKGQEVLRIGGFDGERTGNHLEFCSAAIEPGWSGDAIRSGDCGSRASCSSWRASLPNANQAASSLTYTASWIKQCRRFRRLTSRQC